MILADKIINERKKNGWSQEELADKLSVSRQSVSKWEGAQAVPDLQKIIAMADVFGVSTDYLLKEEIEPEVVPVVLPSTVETVSAKDVRRVTLEEANDFLELEKRNAPKIANGVSMCIISPVILIILSGLSEVSNLGLTEGAAVAIGLVALLAMISVAVYSFVIAGSASAKYEYLQIEEIETAYGVDGMVQNRMKEMEGRRTSNTALGVILCILCAVPLLIAACLELNEMIILSMVCLLLVIVSVAVNLFVRVGREWTACEQLLQLGDYTVINKAASKKVSKVAGIYWALVLAGYLAWSFITMKWEITWMVWPISAIVFGAVACIIRAIYKKD